MVSNCGRQGKLTVVSTFISLFPPEVYSTKKCHICTVPLGPGGLTFIDWPLLTVEVIKTH